MVVELKIKKKNPWAGLIKYKSCFDYIAPYFTRSGSIYTGLTPDEERYYEKVLGYAEGTLAKSSDFWKTFCVKVGSRTVLLDDQYPRQEMIIKFLSGHKRVATSLDKFTAGKDYLLINREAEAIEANKINKLRRDAIKEFDKLTLEQMRKCLRIMGVKADTNEMIRILSSSLLSGLIISLKRLSLSLNLLSLRVSFVRIEHSTTMVLNCLQIRWQMLLLIQMLRRIKT